MRFMMLMYPSDFPADIQALAAPVEAALRGK